MGQRLEAAGGPGQRGGAEATTGCLLSRRDHPIRPTSRSRAWSCSKPSLASPNGADLPCLRFHNLRHLAASLLLEGRVDFKTISDVLGHGEIGITANLYAHLAPSLRREAAQALDAVLDAAG